MEVGYSGARCVYGCRGQQRLDTAKLGVDREARLASGAIGSVRQPCPVLELHKRGEVDKGSRGAELLLLAVVNSLLLCCSFFLVLLLPL